MAHVARDQLYMLPPGHVFTTPCMAARMTFRFYVMIMVCADGGEVSFTSPHGSVKGSVVAARPSAQWLIQAEGTQLVAALINPTHPLFSRFRGMASPGAVTMPLEPFLIKRDAMQAAYQGNMDIPGAAAMLEDIIRIGADMMPPRDERPLRWQAQLDTWLASPTDNLDALAEEVGVSPDRMSRLFQSAVGLPMRSYLLWRKTHRITELFGQGLSLTELAHAAGFADSAHMCRVFQDVFGAPPRQFLRNDIVQMRTWLTHPGEPERPRLVA
jgi:AraC-like DNA-binding protein